MNLTVEPRTGVPIHVQLSRQIRARITAGEFSIGERIPPEDHLARRLGISRNTVRQALATLVAEGLLVRRAGDGTRIAPQPTTEMGIGAWSSFSGDLAAQGIAVETFAERIVTEMASPEVARGLEIEPGTSVVLLDRVRGYNGVPAVWFRSWFHPRLGLTDGARFDGPLYAYLEAQCGVIPTVSREELSAAGADESLAAHLRVESGAALMVRRRVVSDAAGHPLEYACNWYRPDRFTYTLVMNRPQEQHA